MRHIPRTLRDSFELPWLSGLRTSMLLPSMRAVVGLLLAGMVAGTACQRDRTAPQQDAAGMRAPCATGTLEPLDDEPCQSPGLVCVCDGRGRVVGASQPSLGRGLGRNEDLRSYSYEDGRLVYVSISGPAGVSTVTVGYRADGRRDHTSITASHVGIETHFEYDAAGRVVRLDIEDTASGQSVQTFEYDAKSLRIATEHFHGAQRVRRCEYAPPCAPPYRGCKETCGSP